jgi:hypothetical protein
MPDVRRAVRTRLREHAIDGPCQVHCRGTCAPQRRRVAFELDECRRVPRGQHHSVRRGDADGGRTADDHVRDRASEVVDVRELDVRLFGREQALIEHPHARVVGSKLDRAVARQTERFGVRKRHGD